MKKIIFVSLFTLLLVFSASAYSAEEGWYMSGSFGPVLLDDTGASLSEANYEALTGEDYPTGTTGAIEVEFDPGLFLKFAPGYNFGDFRLESAITYMINQVDMLGESWDIPEVETGSSRNMLHGGDVTNISLLFNGYYDFLKGNALRPYITGGIGMAYIKTHIQVIHDSCAVFSYQAGLGLSYHLNEEVVLDFGYRYFQTSDIEFSSLDLANSGHSLLFGVRYNF